VRGWCERRAVAAALGLLLPAAACQGFSAARPSIILIVVDTLRVDYLGAYGFQGDVSPHFDRLAGESLLFRRCIAQAPWTKPAVASLFTSLYPQVHGITNHEGNYWGPPTATLRAGVLPDAADTLAERLRERGYRTAAFVANAWLDRRYGFGQGFELYDDEPAQRLSTLDDFSDRVLTWLRARGPDEPYFVWIHPMDVHAPYNGEQHDFTAVRGSPSVASPRRLTPKEMPEARYQNLEFRPPWAADAERTELSYWRARYASGVRGFDRRLGALLAGLRREGHLERSLLVVTSDHGEELFEHGDWSHGHTLFDHQVHVPLLLRRPGGRGGGRVVEGLVEQIDLMPSLLALAGAAPVAGMQGQDVSGRLQGGPEELRQDALATATQRQPGLHALRTTTHKLTFDADSGALRLYDLLGDPGERNDISQARPELADRLRQTLVARVRAAAEHGTLRAETTPVPEADRERLRALGYVK